MVPHFVRSESTKYQHKDRRIGEAPARLASYLDTNLSHYLEYYDRGFKPILHMNINLQTLHGIPFLSDPALSQSPTTLDNW